MVLVEETVSTFLRTRPTTSWTQPPAEKPLKVTAAVVAVALAAEAEMEAERADAAEALAEALAASASTWD
jgi:hypothetical protein